MCYNYRIGLVRYITKMAGNLMNKNDLHISVWVNKELYLYYKKLVKKESTSMSQITRKILTDYKLNNQDNSNKK